MTKRNFNIMSILVLALMFMAVFSPRADARSAYLTSCMTAASNATGCHPSAAGIAGKAPTLTSNDCKCCHHHGMASTPVVTTDKTTYTSTENILFKFTGGSQNGRSGLVIYNLAGTSEVARGVIAEDNSATLSVPASVFGAITTPTAIITKWHGNAINTTGGAGTVCTTQVPCTAHDFSAAINTPAITITTGCTRVAPTVTFNPTSGTVAPGGTVTYTATVTNKDTGTCANSTFALSIPTETGTTANFIKPSTLSAASCALAPGGTCTSTLTVKAQTAAVAGSTNATTVRATDATNHSALLGNGTVTTTVSTTPCTRVAPTVTFNPTSGTVAPGGTVTYTATVTNKDSATCANSTFALSIPTETGTTANFVKPSTLSASSCALAPGGTCTSTLTVKAQAAAADKATNATTVRATDATNHSALLGNGTVTTTVAAVVVTTSYKVLAYNDLGMHCACPGNEYFSVLPPFNVIRAQVLQIGAADPVVVSSGVNVSYAMTTPNETDAYLQTDAYFKNIIAYSPKMYPGYQPVVNGKIVSISGAGLAGAMTYNSTAKAYEVIGIPAFPVPTGTSDDILIDPINTRGPKRDPYLTASITVKNTAGTTLATTNTVVPVAWGGCCACHIQLAKMHGKNANLLGSFEYMGNLHGTNSSKIDFSLIDPDGDGKPGPIRCSWCHWDPAMGESSAPGLPKVWPNYKILRGATFTSSDIRTSSRSFSDVLHEFHVKSPVVLTQFDANIAKNCYDCHPGNGANCYRGAMKTATVWCTDCHGDLNQRVATAQMTAPWQQSTLPTCNAPSAGITTVFTCHDAATYPTPGTWDNQYLGKFINSRGHQGSILCSTCHGSPHAEAPSTWAADNAQNIAAQNDPRPLGKCDYCHTGMSSTWGVPPHANITQ